MRKFWIAMAIGAVLCLAIGIIWTVRLDVPSPPPWWYGKNAVVRFEVWEPGKDMATVAGTIPKGPLDAAYAFGFKADVSLDDNHRVELKRVWRKLQRLPKGEKLTYEEEGARIDLWIDVKGAPAGS